MFSYVINEVTPTAAVSKALMKTIARARCFHMGFAYCCPTATLNAYHMKTIALARLFLCAMRLALQLLVF